IPVINAAFSRGYANELAFKATIWKPPARNVERDASPTVSMTEPVNGARANDNDSTVNTIIRPTGRGLSAANLSAAHPQKKYPTPQKNGGNDVTTIHNSELCATPSARLKYAGKIIRIGPGEIHVSA